MEIMLVDHAGLLAIASECIQLNDTGRDRKSLRAAIKFRSVSSGSCDPV
jgi:hypothetical protein